MASNLGALTVSLGLDAAEYTRGLNKAEKDAYEFGQAIGTGIRNAATTAVSALAALGVSAGGAVAAFSKLIDGIGQFADLSDKTGASAEALASFSVAATTSGVSMDKVASATNTLTRNLVGVGDETKAAGAALKALGIPLEEFKALKPEEQIDRLSKTFAAFEDGAGKSATAMALFGKSGADVLPFLKTLEEQGGRQVILTQELIDQADAYGDRQAKAKAELELYAQVLAAQAIPMLTAFTGALTDTAKEILGVGQGATDLKSNTAVADFAENAVRVLGFIIDAADGVVRAFQIIGKSIAAQAAAVAAVMSGDFSGAVNIAKDGAADVKAILDRPLFSDKLNKRIADAKAEAAKVTPKTDGPQVKYGGPAKKGGGGRNTAAQEAKAQLAADLSDIKNAQDAITDGYRNQERILQAERSAGLKDESAYYAEKVRLMDATAAAQEEGLRKSIARLEQEKLSGKDAIDNARKIAAEQAKLVKVQEDAATSARVAAIEHEAAMRRIEAALLSARQAAQDFFDTTNRGYARELAGVGQGQQQRDFSAAIQQIEDKYQQQRQQLQNQRAQSELQGTFGPEAQKQFDAQIAIINEFQKKSVDSYTTYYQSLQALQKDWAVGASEALKNYANEAQNVAQQVQGAFTDGFKGLEDALTEFVTTGKADFKSLADSIIKDIARIVIKQNITGPLAQALSGALGGGNVGLANSMGGNSLDNFLSLNNSFGTSGGGGWLSLLGGLFGKASGGIVGPNSMFRVNENGPEMLDYQGKQYLMTGTGSGRVTATSKLGSTVVQNFTVGDVATQSLVRQSVQTSQQRSAAALARSSRYGGAFA